MALVVIANVIRLYRMCARDMTRKNKSKWDLAQLFEALDERSRAILWHLWRYRHAQISELRRLINAASDCEVLTRLKEVINGKGQELWGKPVVNFEESKNDPLTGEKILFSWWLLDGENVPMTSRDKLLVDVFDEKDTLTIIAQLPGWDGPSPTKMECKNRALEVTVNHIKYKNGILQISLEKGRK